MSLWGKSSRFLVADVLVSVVVLPAGVSATQEKDLLGFSARSAAIQRELEAQVLGGPSAERMDEYHRIMTAAPHHAGTEANEKIAEYYAARLEEFGFDEIIMNRYEVLLPRPKKRERWSTSTTACPPITRFSIPSAFLFPAESSSHVTAEAGAASSPGWPRRRGLSAA